MKKAVSLALAMALSLGLTGCSGSSIFSNYREIENLEIIRTIGIDSTPGGVDVTACTGLTGTDSGPRIYEKQAASIGSALNELQKLPLGKVALLSHVENLLIGQDQAEDGIGPFLGYMERYSETRLQVTPFVVRGSAQDLIVGATGQSTSCTDILGSIREQAAYVGSGWPYTCRDVAISLARRGCALILAVEGVKDKKLFEERGEMDILPSGFAIIEDGSLAGYLGRQESLGVLMLTQTLKSSDLELECSGVAATLMLTGCEAAVHPSFDGSELQSLTIELTVGANIINLGQGGRLWEDSFIREMESALSQELYDCARAALNRSQDMGLDFMGLGDMVELANPVSFSLMDSDWQEVFPRLPVKLRVTGQLQRTYDINDPVATDGREEEPFWKKATGSL